MAVSTLIERSGCTRVSRVSNDTADRKAMQVRANLGSAAAAGDVDGGPRI
jgi:hypothetical protein